MREQEGVRDLCFADYSNWYRCRCHWPLTGICNKSMSNEKALQSISRLTKGLVFRIRQSCVTLEDEEVEELRKAGGIVSLIGSILAVFAAVGTLFIGGCGSALEAEGASTIIGLGWIGLILSIVLIVFSVMIISGPSTSKAIWIIVLSIVAALFGGTLVAICMILSIVGGVLAYIGSKQEVQTT